ncbi:copper amine oxidase N-terminal domain-containing protein [Paenibacillus sp. 32O-W]|uniref:copper amine oxidase N-terminal domain-containing protein n=1 Tax=Paenibacillus sp. 32O-W TaxID=1695218 RepID=UPI0011A11B0B|nr:copper amine oxidase N-terminal domain-containing protein [Paenibacillus sp. 32O-W]
MCLSRGKRSIWGMFVAFAILIGLVIQSIPEASANSDQNIELLRSEHKVIDGKMKVTADVRVESSELVSLLVTGYNQFGEIIEIKKEDTFIMGGNTKVFQLTMDHGEELTKVDIEALGPIEEPYKVLKETTVAHTDHLEGIIAVKNGGKSQMINVVATGTNANGKVVEVRGANNFVMDSRISIFKIKLDAVNEINDVKFTVLTDDQTYLVETGTYIKDGKIVLTSVVKNGEKSQKISARVTPYAGNGKELSIQTDTNFTMDNRLYNLKMQIKDTNASSVAVQFYDETGKQEIVKRGTLVTIDGKGLATEQPPVNLAGNVVVPMRAIFEAMGAGIEWEQETMTVTATKGSKEIKLQIGSDTAYIDGQEYTLNVPAQLINNNTMVPVRFVSEALGAKVFWDNNSQTVLIVR